MTDIERGIPIGTWNNVQLVFGLRGYGKSTYCIVESMEIGYPANAIIIAHSLGARLPEHTPDGFTVNAIYHASIESLSRGVKWKPERIHVKVGGEADDVIRYARDLSTRIRKSAWRREKGWLRRWSPMSRMDGIVATPIILIMDESVALTMNLGKTSHRNEDSRYFREALYSARHEHISYLFQIQDPNAIGPAVQTQATKYVCFHLEHEWALNALRAMGADRQMMEEIPTLGIGEYIEFGPSIKRTENVNGDTVNRDGSNRGSGNQRGKRDGERGATPVRGDDAGPDGQTGDGNRKLGVGVSDADPVGRDKANGK